MVRTKQSDSVKQITKKHKEIARKQYMPLVPWRRVLLDAPSYSWIQKLLQDGCTEKQLCRQRKKTELEKEKEKV